MVTILRSGYKNYLALDPQLEAPLRHMVYKSVAAAIPAIKSTNRLDLADSDFALGVTFANPTPDPEHPFSSLVTRIQVLKNGVAENGSSITHLRESITLEKDLGIPVIIEGFKQAQDNLSDDAVLVSVSALYGLTQALHMNEHEGIIVITHTPVGTSGLMVVDEKGEILTAHNLAQYQRVDIRETDEDVIGELALIYNILTSDPDDITGVLAP